MKAWWRIHDKPRGRWRPLIEFGVTFTPEEGEEIKALNVELQIKTVFGSKKDEPGFIYLILPERPFDREAKSEGREYRLGYSVSSDHSWCYNATNAVTKSTWRGISWSFRLPWRPGARPDYSDFINPVRDFLHQVLEEMERRLQEALESAPSEEWLLEEEFDSFSRQTSDIEEERKLRVIRR